MFGLYPTNTRQAIKVRSVMNNSSLAYTLPPDVVHETVEVPQCDEDIPSQKITVSHEEYRMSHDNHQ